MGNTFYNSKTFFVIKLALLTNRSFYEVLSDLRDDRFELDDCNNLAYGPDFRPLKLELAYFFDIINP